VLAEKLDPALYSSMHQLPDKEFHYPRSARQYQFKPPSPLDFKPTQPNQIGSHGGSHQIGSNN
jgi:hypothetical protein